MKKLHELTEDDLIQDGESNHIHCRGCGQYTGTAPEVTLCVDCRYLETRSFKNSTLMIEGCQCQKQGDKIVLCQNCINLPL